MSVGHGQNGTRLRNSPRVRSPLLLPRIRIIRLHHPPIPLRQCRAAPLARIANMLLHAYKNLHDRCSPIICEPGSPWAVGSGYLAGLALGPPWSTCQPVHVTIPPCTSDGKRPLSSRDVVLMVGTRSMSRGIQTNTRDPVEV